MSINTTATNYTATSLIKTFHKTAHYDFSFHSVDSTFRPEDKDYQEALIQLFLPFVFIAVWIVIWQMIKFCCCRGASVSSFDSGKARGYIALIVILGILVCGVTVLGFVGNHSFDNGVDKFHSNVLNLSASYDKVLKLGQSAQAYSGVALQQLNALTFPPDVQAEVNDLSGALNDVYSETSQANQDAAEFKMKGIVEDIKKYNKKRSMGTIGFTAGLCGFAFVAIVAAIARSHALMKIDNVILVILFSLCFILSGVELALIVGGADYCYNPNDFAASRINEPIVSYYVYCAPNTTSPLRNDQDAAKQAISYGINLALAIQANATSVNMTNVINAMIGCSTYLDNFIAYTMCPRIHAGYVNCLTAFCDDALDGVIMMMVCHLVVALLFLGLINVLPKAWVYFDSSVGFYLSDDPIEGNSRSSSRRRAEKEPLIKPSARGRLYDSSHV